MIVDPSAAAESGHRNNYAGAIIIASGITIRAKIESVCLHGESPRAVATAKTVRARLVEAGLAVSPFAPMT